MQEALDLAINIVNFVGTTCVQRYYFWLAYTLGASGESLIWGDPHGKLILPKKYFVYKHFVQASNTINGSVEVKKCNDSEASGGLLCIQFGEKGRIMVNTEFSQKPLGKHECSLLCCTTEIKDNSCDNKGFTSSNIPARSVCHCILR